METYHGKDRKLSLICQARHEKISLLVDNLYIFAFTNMTCQALPNIKVKLRLVELFNFFWLLKLVLRVKTGLPCQSGHANMVLF